MTTPNTVALALAFYLDEIGQSRAQSTWRTYGYIIGKFETLLTAHGLPPDETALSSMTNEWVQWFLSDIRHLSPTTERGYIAPIVGFYEYVVAKGWLDLNLTELRYFVRRRRRKLPKRVQQFPSQQLGQFLRYLKNRVRGEFKYERLQLAAMRDCALYHLLADSGLRISEACNLRRKHLDWEERLVFVHGKGDKEALVRVSERFCGFMKRYLRKRKALDVSQTAAQAELPLFARHDRRVSTAILPISPRAAQKNINKWLREIWGDDQLYEITPHTFRHYFVTKVLRGTGGDIEKAKKLARHADINTTMRYAHLSDAELDQAYDDLFN